MTGGGPSESDRVTSGSPYEERYGFCRARRVGDRVLVAGTAPIAPDGSVPPALVDQAEVIWANIGAMLRDASMGPGDVVSVTTYVTPGQDLAGVMAVRDRALEGNLAASTLIVVAELARPEWLMEIAIIAAA